MKYKGGSEKESNMGRGEKSSTRGREEGRIYTTSRKRGAEDGPRGVGVLVLAIGRIQTGETAEPCDRATAFIPAGGNSS